MLNANSLFSKYKKNYFCPILKKAILMLLVLLVQPENDLSNGNCLNVVVKLGAT